MKNKNKNMSIYFFFCDPVMGRDPKFGNRRFNIINQ